MSVLSDSKIKEAVASGLIKITDFDESRLGPNSYNLRLGKKMLIYAENELDMKKENKTIELEIPDEGYVLQPDTLYLGETMEWTECGPYLPMMEGRSSIGRLGIDINICAGSGDVGFKGKWTLEIRVIHPVRVYPGVEICQLLFHNIDGKVDRPYHGKYLNSEGVVASRMDKDFTPDKGYYYDDNQLNWYNYNKSLVKDIFKDSKSRPFIFGQKENKKLTESETDYARNFISDVFGEMLKILDVSNSRRAYYIKEFKESEDKSYIEAEKHDSCNDKNSKSLSEVIPAYLRKILAALGQDEIICNCGKYDDILIPTDKIADSDIIELVQIIYDCRDNLLNFDNSTVLHHKGEKYAHVNQIENFLNTAIDKLVCRVINVIINKDYKNSKYTEDIQNKINRNIRSCVANIRAQINNTKDNAPIDTVSKDETLQHLNPVQFDELYAMLKVKSPEIMELLYPALFMDASDVTDRVRLSNGMWLDINKLLPIINDELIKLGDAPLDKKITSIYQTNKPINSLEGMVLDKTKNKIIIIPEYRDKNKDIEIDIANSCINEIKFR